MTQTTIEPITSKSNLYVDSTDLLDQPEKLRQRAAEDGYLFFKGLLPAAEVVKVRADVLRVLDSQGWLDRSKDLMDGVVDMQAIKAVPDEDMRLDIGVSHAIYHGAQKLESLHALPHHPRLLELYRTLFDSEVLVHPRHIARIVTAHPGIVPTPIHQDFPHVQGAADTWTCWFPLGNCARTMGGLTVLRGSQRNGYLAVQPAPGAGGLEALLCPWENDWVEGDFETGDVLTFQSFTVHKALPALERDLVRISLDVRYQSVLDPIENASLLPHTDLTWEQIYENWESDDLKYYWREQNVTITPFDQQYLQTGRRIC